MLHPPSNQVLFTNPHTSTSRTNGVLQSSSNDGKTWQVLSTIDKGVFAYSCLSLLPAAGGSAVNATHVAVIYEGKSGLLLLATPAVTATKGRQLPLIE